MQALRPDQQSGLSFAAKECMPRLAKTGNRAVCCCRSDFSACQPLRRIKARTSTTRPSACASTNLSKTFLRYSMSTPFMASRSPRLPPAASPCNPPPPLQHQRSSLQKCQIIRPDELILKITRVRLNQIAASHRTGVLNRATKQRNCDQRRSNNDETWLV